MQYIILSPKHSDKNNTIFWMADDAGYTDSPFAAGIYTQQQIEARPDYYNNGRSGIAIPLTNAAMNAINFKVSIDWDKTDQFLQKTK